WPSTAISRSSSRRSRSAWPASRSSTTSSRPAAATSTCRRAPAAPTTGSARACSPSDYPRRVAADDRIPCGGHATVLIELDGARLLPDPVLRSRIGHLRRHAAPPTPGVAESLDAVLLSHLHMDHLDLRSLERIDPAVPVLAPAG